MWLMIWLLSLPTVNSFLQLSWWKHFTQKSGFNSFPILASISIPMQTHFNQILSVLLHSRLVQQENEDAEQWFFSGFVIWHLVNLLLLTWASSLSWHRLNLLYPLQAVILSQKTYKHMYRRKSCRLCLKVLVLFCWVKIKCNRWERKISKTKPTRPACSGPC